MRFYRYLFMIGALLGTTDGRAAVWHVDGNAAPGGDGVSWNTSFTTLDEALEVASPGDRIWVATGVYRPTSPTADKVG
ncbi:MAG: hypothetical protein KDC38_04720, partial [Planctomycetes bacterium]|nr:hypothetical protein [Planctomycetota bacterium]